MTDLVEKVARAIWGNSASFQSFDDASEEDRDDVRGDACAAIATVLDDLMEPDSTLLEAAGQIKDTEMNGPYRLSLGGWQAYEHWQCILNGIRAELGLASPAESKDQRWDRIRIKGAY